MIPGERPIAHLKVPNESRFHFEWHTFEKKVYMIDVRRPDTLKVGHLIATDVEDQGRATTAVLVWLRGYNFARKEAEHEHDERAA